MHIEAMTISDYDELYKLWLACKGMGLNDIDDSKAGIDRFLKRNPDLCFIAKTNNKIVGSILIGNDGRRGYIYHTAVLPDYQRRGVGSALVNAGLDALDKIGISKAALLVFERNKNGNIFWEKLGFTKRDDLVYRNIELKATQRIDT